MKKTLLLLYFFGFVPSSGKVLLMVPTYNRPDFIELQVKTFKAFLQDDYEYVVFNDASQEDMARSIEQTCNRLNVRCFRFPQHIHAARGMTSPGHRHMDVLAYFLEQMGYDFPGIVAIVDSDLFLLKSFSIENYLRDYDISGELQGRENDAVKVRHLSPILVFMNMQTLPNKRTISFEGGYIEGLACDVGANTYYYLQNNPTVKSRIFTLNFIPALKRALSCSECSNFSCQKCVHYLKEIQFDDKMIAYVQSCPDDNTEFVLDNTFLHYRCGTNWDNKPGGYHDIKTKALNNLIHDLLYIHYYKEHALKGTI